MVWEEGPEKRENMLQSQKFKNSQPLTICPELPEVSNGGKIVRATRCTLVNISEPALCPGLYAKEKLAVNSSQSMQDTDTTRDH